MNKNNIIGIIILVVIVAGGLGYTLYENFLTNKDVVETSDAANIKGTINIALDSWIGYFPLRSPVFKRLMKEDGYLVEITDDGADYQGRMKSLKKGDINFAVCTVDAYLLNGKDYQFPGVIPLIIDESKGGDALVAWKDKISTLDALKTTNREKIAYTPDSPSHHLLKAIGVHFGIDTFIDGSKGWQVETDGAEDGYNRFMNKEVSAAVLWEPFVTKAVANGGVVKLLGSEDTEKLIVDILLVNREFAKTNNDLITMVLKNYFETMNVYSSNPDSLKNDIAKETGMDGSLIDSMLKGVKWVNMNDNALWFGIGVQDLYNQEPVIQAIESALSILEETGDISGNPFLNNNPYTIINSDYIDTMYQNSGANGSSQSGVSSLAKDFTPLDKNQWDSVELIGSLKLRPISFQSGTDKLDLVGEEQVDLIVDTISHYPNFRIVIKGHTGTRGDADANRELSQKRAQAIEEYLMDRFSIDADRIYAVGIGSDEPLKQMDGESSRAYQNRLKRVEVFLADYRYDF